MNKIMNLKMAQELSSKMFNLVTEKFWDCNRNFTGVISKDVEIQKGNIVEGQEMYLKQQSIFAKMTKAAMKNQDEFDAAVKEAHEFIASLS